MAVELVKDILKVDELKGKDETQTMVEAEIYLNQSKPEIDKILWVDGKAQITNSKIVQDKVIINGIVKFKAVYKSKEENPRIFKLETVQDFRNEVELEGINENMTSDVKIGLEYIEYELLDERKVGLKSLVNIQTKVGRTNTLEVIKDIRGGEDTQILKEKIKYNDVIGMKESYTIVKEAFEIEEGMPPIDDILKAELNTYEKESKVVDGRVIISGILDCLIVYNGEGNINSLKKEISFNHFLEIEGAEKDLNCQIKMEVESVEYEIKEDSEGISRILELESKVKILGKVYDNREKEIVLDMYSTDQNINLKKEKTLLLENVKNLICRETVTREIDMLGDILTIEGRVSILDSRYIEGKVVTEGTVNLNILYVEENTGEIKNSQEEIPFKFYNDIDGLKGNISVEVESILEQISYKVNDGGLNIEAAVKNSIMLNREKEIDIIVDLEETGEALNKKNRPSITVYIVQKDDILWDIAKRYHTTVKEIMSANNITSPQILMPGEKIIIEKHVDTQF